MFQLSMDGLHIVPVMLDRYYHRAMSVLEIFSGVRTLLWIESNNLLLDMLYIVRKSICQSLRFLIFSSFLNFYQYRAYNS